MEEEVEESELIVRGNRAASTIKTYESKIKKVISLLQIHFAEGVHPDGSLILPITLEAAKKLTSHVFKHADGKNKSVSEISNVISSIKYHHEVKGVPMVDEVNRFFKQYTKGYKRKVAEARENGEMPLMEGKLPLTFQGYRLLCERSLDDADDVSVVLYGHLYTILCWNLIARSTSVAHLRYDHITWKDDAMYIHLPRHKGDQEGSQSYPKAIYANPKNPEMCPVLALAIHFLCSYSPQGILNIDLMFSLFSHTPAFRQRNDLVQRARSRGKIQLFPRENPEATDKGRAAPAGLRHQIVRNSLLSKGCGDVPHWDPKCPSNRRHLPPRGLVPWDGSKPLHPCHQRKRPTCRENWCRPRSDVG